MENYDFYSLKFGYCILNSKTNGYICKKNGKLFFAREPFNKEFLESSISEWDILKKLIKKPYKEIKNTNRLFILENDNLIKNNDWEIEDSKNYPCYFKVLKKTMYKILITSIIFSLFIFISYNFLNRILYPSDLSLVLLIIGAILLFIFYIGIKFHNKKILQDIKRSLKEEN